MSDRDVLKVLVRVMMCLILRVAGDGTISLQHLYEEVEVCRKALEES